MRTTLLDAVDEHTIDAQLQIDTARQEARGRLMVGVLAVYALAAAAVDRARPALNRAAVVAWRQARRIGAATWGHTRGAAAAAMHHGRRGAEIAAPHLRRGAAAAARHMRVAGALAAEWGRAIPPLAQRSAAHVATGGRSAWVAAQPALRTAGGALAAAWDATARSFAAAAFLAGRAWRARPLRSMSVLAVTVMLPIGTTMALGPPMIGLMANSVAVEVGEPETFGPLAERSKVLAGDGSTLAVLHGEENRRTVPLEEIPEHVRHAVIAAEDRRFAEHGGFDVVAIARAADANFRANEVVQGGSTITQQLAKQNFVGDEQSLARKMEELTHAVALEAAHDKDELLERYLNQVYFGAGAYGIAAAAEEYFRVDPGELSVDQAALLAGQIRAPGVTDPRGDPDAAKVRRDVVIAQMAADGHLTAEEAQEYQARPVEVEPPIDRTPSEPYVVERAKREFLANPAFGDTREERIAKLFGGGVTIETTIDLEMQAIARDTVARHAEALAGPGAALAAVEPGTGRILAMAGAGSFDERQFDLATQGRRQAGSAFKTFAMIAALEAGVDPGDRFTGQSPDEHEFPDETWTVQNFGGQSFGEVTLHEAIVRSVNTAFAELTIDLGHERVVDVARRLGISDRAFGDPSSHGPAISLGGLTHGVSPLEMAAAYAAIAAEGRYAPPFLVERVTGPDGEVIFERGIDPEQALDPAVAAQAIHLLQDVVQAGTGTAAQLADWPVAGKTGTSQNSADAWFVGTTPTLSTAVWVGDPDTRSPLPGLTGGGVCAPLWQEFTAAALAGTEPQPFPG